MKTTFPTTITNYKEFTNNIIEYFHTPTRQLFQESLISLSALIEQYKEIEELKVLQQHIEQFSRSMEEHLQKEESILFPLIHEMEQTKELTYKQMLLRPIAKMEEEHEAHSFHIEPLLHYIEVLHHMDIENIHSLITTLTTLINLTTEHIYIENEVLFTSIKGK